MLPLFCSQILEFQIFNFRSNQLSLPDFPVVSPSSLIAAIVAVISSELLPVKAFLLIAISSSLHEFFICPLRASLEVAFCVFLVLKSSSVPFVHLSKVAFLAN
ncbi:hypothetical protein K1719_023734 [Acacia pycnantha]|nr:hypothetical protein K1719_023734 [Acacia pycnantha]